MRAIKIDPIIQKVEYIDVEPASHEGICRALDAVVLDKTHIRDGNFLVVSDMSYAEHPWTYSLRDIPGVSTQFDHALILRIGDSGWESTSMTAEQVRELVIWQERETVFLNI